MSTRPIEVSYHAAETYKRRLHDPRSISVLKYEIECLVRNELVNRREIMRKPKEFRLYRERRSDDLKPGQRFVFTDNVGWIIAREDDKDVVLTTIVRAEVPAK